MRALAPAPFRRFELAQFVLQLELRRGARVRVEVRIAGGPFCSVVSASTSKLDHHVISEHSVGRPFLLLEGREPPRITVLRTPITSSTVHVANTTNIVVRVDHKPAITIPTPDLARMLSQFRREDVFLTLSNSFKANVAEVSETYRVSFRIAEVAALQSVERAFDQLITPSTLTVNSVRVFLEDSRCSGEGAEYAEALGRYAMGILRKEDPDSAQLTTPSALYREDYVQAEEVLREVRRPLAILVTQLTRFALNDFSADPYPTGYWDLDLAYGLMRNPNSDSLPRPPQDLQKRHALCPLDHSTGQILNLAVHMLDQERWSPLLSEECRIVVHSASLDAVDQQKAAAIWAACAWRLGARQEAMEPLRMIASSYPFNQWAAPFLEELAR